MFHEFIDILISGIINGSVYAMMALGMSLIYGVTKIFNFAYGSFYSMGGYLAYTAFMTQWGYPFVFAVTIPALFVIGWYSELLFVKPLRKYDDWEMMAVMVTLGLALLLDNLYQAIYGPFVKSLPFFVTGNIDMGTFVLGIQDITIFVIAFASMVLFMLFLNYTRLGMSVRAVAQNPTGAMIVGVAKNRIFTFTFGISTVMVGISGILLAPSYFVSPFGGWNILVKAWVITAFGGMGSLKGSLVAAFILGIIEALVGWQFGFTWTMFAWFAVLILTLLVRPQGLFGTWG